VCVYGWSLAFPAPLLTVAARDPKEPTHSSVKVCGFRFVYVCVCVYGWSLAFPVPLLTVAARDPREPTHSSVKVCGFRLVYGCVCMGGAWPSLYCCSQWLLGTFRSPHTPLSRCVDLGLCMCVCLCVCKYGWSLAFPVPLLTVAARDPKEPTHSSVKVCGFRLVYVCVFVCVYGWRSLAFPVPLLTVAARDLREPTHSSVKVCGFRFVYVCVCVCMGGAWPSLYRCSQWLLGTLGSPHTPLSRCVDLGLCMCVCVCLCACVWVEEPGLPCTVAHSGC